MRLVNIHILKFCLTVVRLTHWASYTHFILLKPVNDWYTYVVVQLILGLNFLESFLFVPTLYTGQVSHLRRNCHACGSKTWISCFLTSVLRIVTLGGKVWAIMALTDTFWKIYYYLKTPEPMREKKSPREWFSVSKFSYFSRESHWRRGRVPLCSHFHVRQNSSKRLWISLDIIGPLQNILHS